MLLLISKPITPRTAAHLDSIQQEITNAADPVSAAQTNWLNRTNNTAFAEIRQVLETMCVGTAICNYCENNEATDIEHIFPKSFFPEKAFDWGNYLLACKTCNSHYKLDKIAVFNPSGSSTRHDVQRGDRPPTQDVMMINPRSEDPLDFLDLDLRTGVFLEKRDPGSREYLKANYTLEVLCLNTREALREAREARAKVIFRKLQYALNVKTASTFQELDAAINQNEPFISLDTTRPLADVKAELIGFIRNAIVSEPHPTVWLEMKRQQANIPRIADLFTQLPEARGW